MTVADDITVEMGQARVTGASLATVGGASMAGVAVNVGNPHLVCVLDDAEKLASLDLTVPPVYDPDVFPEGVNIEFVVVEAPDRLRMRVHERGVGETRSCGTGTVAAVTGVLFGRGEHTGSATVDVPGGRVRVTVDPEGATLAGPAVFTARGELDQAWWDATRGITHSIRSLKHGNIGSNGKRTNGGFHHVTENLNQEADSLTTG